MLEIRNLTKIYKSKGGVEVRALDDVSLKLPESGMIFLLGKSGSGKSTLLNVCGGLDTPTKGEIIVKGRSSINFKQSDFDSYRNTFVGFIFQEYNILDEFTVEENIALALELQGKEKDQKAIDELLEKVDLKGYSSRKPNTLSGGQKQRLAIARALVKSPEIIMADEPTGALDSQTGKQVFDTLKELSKDTLVIVVSHDRDFASEYADRIIELKDGKIIVDVTKNKANEFINTNDDAIKIKEYEKKDSEFISSKFPLKHAVRIGLSSLKTKKFRLLMTIFLCTIAFMMFGLLSTLVFYDREATFKDTLRNSSLNYIQLTKEYDVKQYYYSNGEETNLSNYPNFGHFTSQEVDNYIKKYGFDSFGAISTDINYNVQDSSIAYWVNSINTLAYLNEDNKYRKNMLGQYPKTDNEIAISSYTANVIINSKIDDYDTGKTLNVNKIDDLIGKKIKMRDTVYTITGIVDSGSISKEYDALKQPGKVNEEIYSQFMVELQDGFHLIAFVTESRLSIEAMENSWIVDNFSDRMVSMATLDHGKYDFDMASYGYYASYDKVKNNYNYLKLIDYTTLDDSQALISYDYFAEIIFNTVSYDNPLYELAYNIYLGGEEYEVEPGEWTIRKYSQTEMHSKVTELYNLAKSKKTKLQFGLKSYDMMEGREKGQTYEFNVVGIFIPEGAVDNNIIISDNNYQKLRTFENNNYDGVYTYETKYVDRGFYDVVYIEYDKSEDATNTFWAIRSNEKLDEYDSREELTGATIYKLDTVDGIVNDFSQIILWVGLVLAIFAALLFSNFISVSILNKRKEIGILRAIGAKGVDIFKIFFSESFILSTICVMTASVGTIIVSTLLNNALDFDVSVFVFGITSIITIILIALLTAFLATFIPVNNAARKKPIDSIRAL